MSASSRGGSYSSSGSTFGPGWRRGFGVGIVRPFDGFSLVARLPIGASVRQNNVKVIPGRTPLAHGIGLSAETGQLNDCNLLRQPLWSWVALAAASFRPCSSCATR